MNFQALIVDDEPFAREELKYLLEKRDEIDIIGSVSSNREAERLLHTQNIDVVFLDVQLMGETGFELIRSIRPETRIIFVTAYNEYAVQAFRVNALDYIMKPINEYNLYSSLDKLRRNAPMPDSMDFSYRQQIVLNLRNRRFSFYLSDLIAIRAGESHVYDLIFENRLIYFRRSIKEWMEILDNDRFICIHRNTIINKDKIEEIRDSGRFIKMNSVDELFKVSRGKVKEIKQLEALTAA